MQRYTLFATKQIVCDFFAKKTSKSLPFKGTFHRIMVARLQVAHLIRQHLHRLVIKHMVYSEPEHILSESVTIPEAGVHKSVVQVIALDF